MSHGGGAVAKLWATVASSPRANPAALLVRKARLAMAWGRWSRQFVFIVTSIGRPPARPLVGDRPRKRLDELLELPRRPALEGLAPRLVGGDHRIAVVPVQARLGIEPERAAGLLGDQSEQVRARIAAVGARVAEHDHGGAGVQVVLDELLELAPHAAVVGVARDVGDAGVAADRLADRLEVALLLEDVGDLGDALDEDERAHLAKRVVQRVQHAEEEHARAGDARRDVAQHVDLRAARTARAELQLHGHAAGLQRRAHRAPHVDGVAALAPARLVALRGQAAAQLGHDAVHGGEVLQRAAGQRAVELVERARRRQRLGALDLRALELAAQQRLEAAQLLARQPLPARVVGRQLGLGLGAQAQRAPDALHVDADDARAFALTPEGGDGQAREVAHRALRAVAQRGGDLRAQLVEVEAPRRVGVVRLVLLAHVVTHGGGLGGAKEVALEDELEDAAV